MNLYYWLDLEVGQNGDKDMGFWAYEAFADRGCEGNWPTIRQWIEQLLDDIESTIEEA